MSRITVLGSGAWGTAIALSLVRRGNHEVTLWSHRQETADALARDRENRRFLPGFRFPGTLQVTGDDELAVRNAGILVCAVPSEHLRPTHARLGRHFHPGQIVVSATKGIEDHSFLRMTQVIAECLEREAGAHSIPIGALSGPSFAQEVAAGMPTAVTIAFSDPTVAAFIQKEFSSPTLRLYTNDDVIGVEMGGALNNVIAIAAGVLAGLGLGSNSAAGLITRGIAEMTRLAVAMGGKPQTLAGLAGLGDLVLTCTGGLSRNRTVGVELAHGRKLDEIVSSMKMVAEGIKTTNAAVDLARRYAVELPISQQMFQMLHFGISPREAIQRLMERSLMG